MGGRGRCLPSIGSGEEERMVVATRETLERDRDVREREKCGREGGQVLTSR
jgi:hypothetical protein